MRECVVDQLVGGQDRLSLIAQIRPSELFILQGRRLLTVALGRAAMPSAVLAFGQATYVLQGEGVWLKG
jgi:hypothetical protein